MELPCRMSKSTSGLYFSQVFSYMEGWDGNLKGHGDLAAIDDYDEIKIHPFITGLDRY